MKATNLFLFVLVCTAPAVFSQSSAFTYQGRLTDQAVPANGTYDLRFNLFGAGGTIKPPRR